MHRTHATRRPAAPSRDTVALALALQPQGPGRPFHAAVATTQGQQMEFHSLSELVNYLVRLSVDTPPPEGLK